jgi:undecaprenyl-diphosphatase
MAPGKYLLLLSLLLLVAALAAFQSAKSAVFHSSASLTESIQTHSHSALDLMFFLIAYTSLAFSVLLLIGCYTDIHPVSGLIVLTLLSICVCFSCLLKLAMNEPRPYWVYSEVRAISCDGGWGSPSGHAMATGTLWGWVIGQMLRTKWRLFASFLLLALLMVGFDRVYLGVHFYSQVVLGWCFAFFLVVFMNLIYRRLQSGLSKMRFKWILLSNLLALGLYALVVITYVSIDPAWEEIWTVNIHSVPYSQKCSLHYSADLASDTLLIEAAVIFALPGACLGYRLLLNSGLKEWWSGRLNCKRICRVLVAALPFALYSLLSIPYSGWAARRIPSTEGAAVVTGLSAYLSGLLFTYAVPILCERLALNREIRSSHVEGVHQVSLQLIETQPYTLSSFLSDE